MGYEAKTRFIINFLYAGLIAFVVYLLLRYALGLLTPFLLALLFAYILKAPARFIHRKTGLPYKPVVTLIVLLFYSTIGWVAALLGIKLIASALDLFAMLPKVYTNVIEPGLGDIFDGIEQLVYRMDPALVLALDTIFEKFVQSLGNLVTSWSMQAVSLISGYASKLPALFIKLLLMVISTFFIAGDFDRLAAFTTRQLSDRARSVLTQIQEYVVGTLFVCIRSYALIMCITCVELSIGLSVIGIENAVLIAMAISVFDILPVLGTGGIMVPWALIAAVRGDYSLALSLMAVYLIVTVVRNILEPKIVGSQIGLHPVVTLASMFVGVQLFGVLGLFGFPILLSLLRHLNETGTIHLFK